MVIFVWWRGRGRGWRRWGRWWWPRPWCWRYWAWSGYYGGYYSGWYGYWQNLNYPQYGNVSQVPQPPSTQSSIDVVQRAKSVLSSASLSPAGYGPFGGNTMLIIHNGNVVGWLWENVPLKEIEIGDQWYTPSGIRVTLIYKGRLVGFLWI